MTLNANLKFFLLTLTAAASYYIAGRLGLLLAIPPGYATAVWPPAGIALATILIFGDRYWFGIFLGSTLTNLYLSFDASTTSTIINSISIASGIGLGAALQALIGSHLIKRFIGYPNALYKPKDILWFSLLSGPIGCLVNATWSAVILYLFNSTETANLFTNWATWWLGDTTGVLVFTPLILIFFAKPRDFWRKRILTVALPLLVMFSIAIVIFSYVRRAETESATHTLKKESFSLSLPLYRSIQEDQATLASLQSFFHASEKVTRQEFKIFSKNIFKQHHNIKALGWVPKVSFKQKDEFIQAAKIDGFTHFYFKDIQDGKLRPSTSSSTLFPVYYVEPYKGNEAALGLNLASSPQRQNALLKSEKTKSLIASQRITLVQETRDHFAVLLFNPVFRRNDRLEGFVLGVFKIDDMLNRLLSPKTTDTSNVAKNFSISLYDRSATKDSQLLYQKTPKITGTNNYKKLSDITFDYNYKFADRDWQIRFTATQDHFESVMTWNTWIILTFSLIFIGIANLLFLITSGQAIAIKKTVEDQTRELKAAEAEKRTLLESAGEGIFGINLLGIVTFINPSAAKLFGYNAAELINKDIHQLTHYMYPNRKPFERQTCKMHTIHEGESPKKNLTDVIWRKDGSSMIIEYTKTPLYQNEQLKGAVITFNDISSQITAKRALEQAAHYDHLTGLTNRKHFLSRLESSILEAKKHNQKIALLYLDLDYFKKVNDSLGHAVGDKLLVKLTKKIQGLLSKNHLFARIGGDEFVIYTSPKTNIENAGQLAVKIIAACQTPININEHKLTITASIGISIYPDDSIDATELLQHADLAMYHVKQSHRNNFQYYQSEMSVKTLRRNQIETELKNIISKKELSLVFEPILNLKTNRIQAYEALSRWKNSTLGDVEPQEFIPIAEDIGFISNIANWVISHAIDHLSEMQHSTHNAELHLSINFSTLDFSNENVIHILIDSMKKYNINPNRIIIEITESALVENLASIKSSIYNLKSRGFKIAIDDFGSGYTSLNYLRQFPVDFLKIDKSFTNKISSHKDERSIVSAIISMCHSLSIEVIAEGIETKEQLSILKALNCDYGQGYLFNKN